MTETEPSDRGETARSARPEDIEQLVSIAVDHARSIVDERGADLMLRRELAYTAEELDSLLSEAMDDDGSDLVAGLYHGVPFGYGLVRYEKLSDGSSLARLDQLLVDPDARKVGVGEAIMNLVLDLARDRGCFGVDSRALPGDRETKNFFESFGLKARQLIVHLTLD